MKVVIFGSRGIDRLEEVEKAVEASGVLARVTEIVSGCALGVDTLAIAYAEKHNLPVKLFPARWEELGRKAGPLRNMEMAAYADFGVAVWDGRSRGTAHMIGLMEGRVFVRQTDDAERFIVTEVSQAEALKAIYENCGDLDLDWDFSRPGQVSLPKGKTRGRQGRLTSIWDLSPCCAHSWPRPWPEALLAALAAADFHIDLQVAGCHDDSCYEFDAEPEESREETASLPADDPEEEESPSPPASPSYKGYDLVTDPADVAVLRAFDEANGLARAWKELFDSRFLDDPSHCWVFLESGAIAGPGLVAEEGRLTEFYLGHLVYKAGLKKIKRLDLLAGLTALRKLVLRLDNLGGCRRLADLASLEELNFSDSPFRTHRKIRKLPQFSGLPNLKKLNLSAVGFRNLAPLAGLTTLEELDLSNNKIQDLRPLANLVSLKRLHLYKNEISDLSPLAGLAALEKLELNDNQITDLSPLANLTALTWLGLDANLIVDLSPLARLAKLRVLYLNDDRIKELEPLANLGALFSLHLASNRIADLAPLAGLTSLKWLNLERNQIGDLSPLAHLTALEHLDLEDNQIRDLSPLAHLPALVDLNLKDNRIRDISPLAGLSTLKTLYLDNNEITILPNLPRLVRLDRLSLSDNPLQDIRALEKVCHGSAQSISFGRGRPDIETKASPEPASPEPARPEPAGRKLLILDLDDTLWGGMVADGDIVFGPDGGREGLAFLDFQRQVKALAGRGLLLAVCSLNDPHMARQPFLARGDMPLALEDFAAFKANWRRKPDNILEIGRELGMPLSEMVFVDNNPVQRAEVRHRLPEVAVPELPFDPGRYIQALKRGGWLKDYFEALATEGEENIGE